jgi:excisionase family DNA binding protein
MSDRARRLVFSPEEAAEMIGISRAKLYELVKSQKVPYRRFPDVAGVKFTQDDIDQILADALRPAVA